MPDPHEVTYYFNLAVEQYADINLEFLLDQCPYSRISALCVGVKNGHFIVRILMSELENKSLVWGSEVNGFFSVRDLEITPCNFKTKLVRIYNAPPNALFLVFPLPDRLNHNQRRYSKRVNLDNSEEDGFSAWHGYMAGGDEEKPPQLRWQKLVSPACVLAELSANGMRLDMQDNSAIYTRIFLNDIVLLKGDFGSTQKPAQLYVLGNVVRKMPKPESEGIMCVGCHFSAWRKISGSETWFRADDQEGVGLIAQWVSRNFRVLAQ